jgi:hypothetical protein
MMEDMIDISVPINFGNNKIETFFIKITGERDGLDQSSILQINSDDIIGTIQKESKALFVKNKRFDTDDIIFILLDAFIALNKKLEKEDQVYIKSIYVRWRDKSTLYSINN